MIRLRIQDLLGFLEVWRDQTWQNFYRGRLFDAELMLRQIKVEALAMGVASRFTTVDLWLGFVLALRVYLEDARRRWSSTNST